MKKPKEKTDKEQTARRFVWKKGDVIVREPTPEEKAAWEKAYPPQPPTPEK